MTRLRATIAAVVLGAGVLLAGCTGNAGTMGTPGSSAAPSSASPHASPVALTCANMIPAGTVKAFKAASWTPEPGPLYVGDIHVTAGLQCTWGGASSERAEIFGRGPIDAATAEEAEQQLVDQGWRRIDAPEGVYITASKDMILNPDDQGYGMTYLFSKGLVKVSSTKQGILLIADPA
jgi:hypothetical protein